MKTAVIGRVSFGPKPQSVNHVHVTVPGIRLSEAAVCVNCDLVFRMARGSCPGCQSKQVMPLSTWLNREAKA